jgi:hypothetical protein
MLFFDFSGSSVWGQVTLLASYLCIFGCNDTVISLRELHITYNTYNFILVLSSAMFVVYSLNRYSSARVEYSKCGGSHWCSQQHTQTIGVSYSGSRRHETLREAVYEKAGISS